MLWGAAVASNKKKLHKEKWAGKEARGISNSSAWPPPSFSNRWIIPNVPLSSWNICCIELGCVSIKSALLVHPFTNLTPSSLSPQHIGPAIPEVSSIWFKLYLYHVTGQGPPSLLLSKGSRLRKLPEIFQVRLTSRCLQQSRTCIFHLGDFLVLFWILKSIFGMWNRIDKISH